MLPDSDQELCSPPAESADMIMFFSPDRPVENGTMYVLPEVVAATMRDERNGFAADR